MAIAKTGDDYGALFTNLARVSDSKTVRIETLPLPDSAAVASALEQRQVDFAVIRPDETLPANAMTAAILREEPVILLTFAASKIEHPDQLAKKRIGAVKLSAADRAALGKILAFHDASDAQIIDIGASADEIKSAVTGKRIDAVAFIDQPDGVWRLVRGG